MRMNVTHAFKYLTHIVSDLAHWNRRWLAFILVCLNYILKIGRTEFKHHVLYAFFVFSLRIVNIEQFHDIWTVLKLVKYLKFSTHILTSFHGALNSYCLSSVTVYGFEHKS